MLSLFSLLTLVSSVFKFSLLYHSSPPHSLSPSLLFSPYYCTHHLLKIMNPHEHLNIRTVRYRMCAHPVSILLFSPSSRSHLTFLTLLLLLISGEISPNPGPPFSNSNSYIWHPSSPGNNCNPLSLICILPLPKTSPPLISCAPWNTT